MAKAKKQPSKRGIKNVEICAAILSDKPPQLPLREELQSLGFEVVLGASGTGIKASKYESRRAVKAYRKDVELQDLRKRRIFPKSPRRIKEKIDSRRRIEQALSLPHACSYESYEIKLQRSRASAPLPYDVDFSTSSSSGRDEMLYAGMHPLSNGDDPLFLTTSEDNVDSHRRNLNKFGRMEVFDIPDVFGAFDDLDESSRVSTDIFCSDNDKYPSGGEANANTNSTNPFDSCEEVEEKKEDERDGIAEHGSFQPARRSTEQGSMQSARGSMEHGSIQSARRSAEHGSIQSARRSAEHGSIQSARRSARHSIEKMGHKEDQATQPPPDDFDRSATETAEENDNPSAERKPTIASFPLGNGKLNSLKGPPSDEDHYVQSTNPEERALREEILKHAEPVMATKLTAEARTPQPLPNADPAQTIVETTPKLSVSWMSSAKNALESLSSEVFKVTTFDKRSGGLTNSLEGVAEDPLSALFRLVSEPDLRLDRIESILADRPELPQVKQSQDGRLTLHTLCDRKMPRRGRGVRTLSTELLLEDVMEYRRAIAMLVGFHPDACVSFDENGDLPVHLAARNLMVWEATWYETVYHAAATETDGSGHAAAMVTNLYHAMSETIECLLTPMLEVDTDSETCKAPGSMGTILPIHVASIFTTSVRTLRLLLEKHPMGASIQCDLGILQTFVPDECLALELHDNLSTDFPKWEINAVDQGSSRKEKAEEDTILRSDLLFAYNPIDPHRFEKDRIRRFESRIQFDATTVIVKSPPRLDSSNGRIWQWMCTYMEPETGRSTYLSSVKRIVSVLTYQPLQLLASMETFHGKRLIDEANSDCAKVIKKRLSVLQDDIAIRELSVEEDITKEPVAAVLPDKRTVECLGRLIFNVPQDQLPLSFVILPYELRKKNDGSFGLVTPNASNLARKFAGFLVALTDPETILEMLHNKWSHYYGQSIFGSKVKNQPAYGSLAVLTESLLGLYKESGCAYFYFIKDETGLPEVEKTNSVFRVDNPTEVVHKLLPLMMLGMVQMRGDSAVFRWTSVLLNRDIVAIPPTWHNAALALETYLVDMNLGKAAEDRAYLEDVIRKFRSLSLHSTIDSKQAGGEWMEEITLLKRILRQDTMISKSKTKYVVVDRDKTLIDLVNYPDELVPSQRVSSPEVIDLTRKMDQLSRSLDLDLYATGSVRRQEEEVEQKDEEPLVWTRDKRIKTSEFPNTMTKRYSPLFGGLPIDKPHSVKEEARDETREQTGIRVWNSVNQVWEDVGLQLFTRGEKFIDNPELLELKVHLHDQAKKLIDLRDQVSHLNQSERVVSQDPVVFDLTNITDSKSSCCVTDSSVSEARNLVIRMGDLEDRLVCNEIEIQHLSMEAYSVEHEGSTMLQTSQEQAVPVRHGNQGATGKAHSEFPGVGTFSVSCSSTDRGKRSWDSAPVKSVRFEEPSDQSGVVELETSSSSCTVSQIAISRRTISNPSPASVALDAATQYSPDVPPITGSNQHPFFIPQVLSFDRTGISLPDSALDFSSIFEADRNGERQSPTISVLPLDKDHPQTFGQETADFIDGPFGAQSDDSGNRAVVENSTERTSSEKESMMTVVGQLSSCSSRANWRGDYESDSDNPQRAASYVSSERENSKSMNTPQGATYATLAPPNPPPIVNCSPTSKNSPTLHSRAQRLSARRKRIRSLKSRCSYGSSSASAESSRPSVRLRIDDAKDLSTSADETTNSSNHSVFRPQTINVPQSLPDREFSGLSVSRSFSNNELADEIDNLILRYTE